MPIEIPLLENKITVGAGKMGRSAPIRQTSGVETGRCLVDISLIHVITNEDEAALCDGFAPGVGRQYRMSFGPGSDGVRTVTWRPAEQSYRIRVAHDAEGEAGRMLFEGPASLRVIVIRLNAKHAVLTLVFRLTNVEPDSVPELARSFGAPVRYEIETVELQTAGKPGATGPLFGGVDAEPRPQSQGPQSEVRRRPAVGPGDLITVQVPEEEADSDQPAAGRVVSVTGSQVTAHRWLDGTSPFTIRGEEILTVTRICGPKGGDADGAISALMDEAADHGVVVEPSHLITAILGANVEEHANGWPITEEVRALAIETAAEATPSEV